MEGGHPLVTILSINREVKRVVKRAMFTLLFSSGFGHSTAGVV